MELLAIIAVCTLLVIAILGYRRHWFTEGPTASPAALLTNPVDQIAWLANNAKAELDHASREFLSQTFELLREDAEDE